MNDSFAADNVNMFTWDATPAAIEKLVLDLNEGQPLIAFDETISITTFQPTRLTLQSSTAIDGGEIRIPVTGGSFTMTNSPEVTLTLTPADLNSVKLTAGIGDSPGNTYLRPFAVVASDVSSIVAVKQTPLPAFNVLADRAAPDLNHFVLDLSGDTVSLTLDEPVNASLLNFTQFTLFNSSDTATSSRNPTGWYYYFSRWY